MIVFAAALAATPAPPPEDAAKTLAAVQAMYDQSCQVRAYGSYDDLCDALRKQLREAKRTKQPAAKPVPAPAPKPMEALVQPASTEASATR